MSEIRVGMSGWTYAPWRGKFYPKKLVQKKELEWASRQVNAIEVNGTFYSLQRPTTFQSWYDQTPAGFKFAVKAPQFITHVLRLKECYQPLCTFLASGLFCLKEKLGPILWQFPPHVTLKDDRFEKFLKMLPMHSRKAEELSHDHHSRIEGRACTDAGGDYAIRHAFEFRHASFMNPDFIAMLKAYGVAAVFADSGGKSPYLEDLTSDFIYMRMHGEDPAFKKGYTDAALKKIAKKIKTWIKGDQIKGAQCVSSQPGFAGEKDAYVFFTNEVKVYSPQDALRLLKELKIQVEQLDQAA